MSSQFGPYDSYIAAQRRARARATKPRPPRTVIDYGSGNPPLVAVPPEEAARLFPNDGPFSPLTPPGSPPPRSPHAGVPAPPPYPGYLSPADQLAQAQALVEAQLLPYRQELERQRLAAQQRSDAHGQAIQGFSETVAKLLGGVAPQVQQGFQSAADAAAAYAGGYSDQFRTLERAAADRTNQLLREQGAPDGQLRTPSGAPDVLYGLNGVLPGRELQTAGAGFRAAAEQLPATALGRGQQDFTANTYAGEDEQAKIDAQLTDLANRAPGLLQTALSDIAGQQGDLQQAAAQAAGQNDSALWTRAGQLASQTGMQYVVENGQIVQVRDKKGQPVPTFAAAKAGAAATSKAVDALQRTADTLTRNSPFIWQVAGGKLQVVNGDDGKPMLSATGQRLQIDRENLTVRQQALALNQIAVTGVGPDGKLTLAARRQWAATFGVDPVTGKPTKAAAQADARLALDQARVQIAGKQLALSELRAERKAARDGDLDAYRQAKDRAVALTQSGVLYTVTRTKQGYQVAPVLDRQGRLVLTTQGRKAASSQTGRKAFTASTRQKLQGIAADSARVAYYGDPNNMVKTIENGKVVAKLDPIAPKSYQEALLDLLAHGFPLPMVQKALNRYFKVGERGRPEYTIQERRALAQGGAAAAAVLAAHGFTDSLPIGSG